MALTIRDAEDSFLLGMSRAKKWRAEFEANFYGPLGATMLTMMMNNLDEDELVELRKMNPQLFDTVIKAVRDTEA